MIRRVALLFAIMGLGQIFNIFGLKYLASLGQWNGVAQIGEIETMVQTLLYIIGFGIQTDAIRTTAFEVDWKSRLDDFQVARVTLSLLLLPFAGLAFYDWTYAVVMVAPALALSCDYVLYARGLPVPAAMIALLRAVLPLASAIAVYVMGFTKGPQVYLLASGLIFVVTNWLIAGRLGLPVWWNPAIRSLKLFLKTLPIGLINLCFFYFGLGVLFFARFLVVTEELAIAYMLMKFYMIYKGGVRVVHQGFVDKMKILVVCFRVDQISALMAMVILGSALVYPASFIGMFFGNGLLTASRSFVLLGISMLVFSLFSSAFTRALLERRDTQVLTIAALSVAVSILFLVLPAGWTGTERILVSVLAGEITMAIGAVWRLMDVPDVIRRMVFLIKCLPAILVPVAFHYYTSESVITYVIAFVLMGFLLLALNYRSLIQENSEIKAG